MEYRELYAETERRLREAGCDSPAFDAVCLLEDVGGLPRGTSPAERPDRSRRQGAGGAGRGGGSGGRPPASVYSGKLGVPDADTLGGGRVLIPRPDTELLCEAAAARLPLVPGGDAPRVLDLCAGSGCVGLGLCSLYPAAAVTAVELSDEAFVYLKENTARYPAYRVWPIQADVLADGERFGGVYQAVLANPPYIPAAELPSLMREVRREPRMALDGGDGLVFYRVIARVWAAKLCPGGFCAVEVGAGRRPRCPRCLKRSV